jgi:hypothetical protein
MITSTKRDGDHLYTDAYGQPLKPKPYGDPSHYSCVHPSFDSWEHAFTAKRDRPRKLLPK